MTRSTTARVSGGSAAVSVRERRIGIALGLDRVNGPGHARASASFAYQLHLLTQPDDVTDDGDDRRGQVRVLDGSGEVLRGR